MSTSQNKQPSGQPPETADPSSDSPTAVYTQRAAEFRVAFERESSLWNRLGNFRLLAFVLGVALLGFGLFNAVSLMQIVGGLLLVAFFVLVGFHRAVGRRRRRAEVLMTINNEALLRVRRDWAKLPVRHKARAVTGEPYAADLDIFGHASLFSLLDTLTTHTGEETLTSWLRTPAPPEEIKARQEAVAELKPLVDFRDELELRGRLINSQRPDPSGFLKWAGGEPWLRHYPWLRPVAVISTVAFWVLAVAQFVGLISLSLWLVPAGLNLILAMTLGRAAHAVLARASAGEAGFRNYASAFELICDHLWTSPRLLALQAQLTANGVAAPVYMRRLHNLANFLIPPSAILYLPLQIATMWDVHLLAGFERWQAQAGTQAQGWLDTLGEVEALSALGRLSYDNPSWALPTVDASLDTVTARSLGHPLIPPDRCVRNDVQVGPPGTFLFVTGSNMSGKSTLLRSIGINIVLAGAGGVVCATALSMPPLELWTSMRVEDSLEQGVSFYMAELQRLKAVVDAAKRDRVEHRHRLFYLLDEILQGTNTAERQIAARRVIMYLVRQGALGAVSTHDLDLAQAPDVAAAAVPVHLTEMLSHAEGGPVMSFDYKLRPGVATSTNALRLMQVVGLDLDDLGDEAPRQAVPAGRA